MECEIKGKPVSVLVDNFAEVSVVPPSDIGLDDGAKYTSGLTTYQEVWEAVTLADQTTVRVEGPVSMGNAKEMHVVSWHLVPMFLQNHFNLFATLL
ncbi:Hypothetical predicted protein, partial [Olea europaea subsp. europaea]